MADTILATLLLVGGLAWAFLVFMAAAHHPTGGGKGTMAMFLAGAGAAALGALYWVWIIAGWLF